MKFKPVYYTISLVNITLSFYIIRLVPYQDRSFSTCALI